MTVTIVALGRYNDIFQYFREQLDTRVDSSVRKILIRDGNEIQSAPGWEILQGAEDFTMAGNHNLGWKAVAQDSDILTMNDDIYWLEPDPIAQLQALAYSDPQIGAVAPRCKIGFFGNPLQMNPRPDVPLTFVRTCTTGCLYLKRSTIDRVGYLDESFTEKYSAEDADFTWRINLSGLRVGIARDIPIKHGFGTNQSTSTSFRSIPDIGEQGMRGVERFRTKYGHFDVLGEWKETF